MSAADLPEPVAYQQRWLSPSGDWSNWTPCTKECHDERWPIEGARSTQHRSLHTADQVREAIEADRKGREECVWTFDDDPHAPMWTSPCGIAYSFTEGGPEDNGHRFCHCCGKPMKIAEPQEAAP